MLALDKEDALVIALDEQEALLMLVENSRFLPILAIPDPRHY